jgi:hypothetical protein
MISLNRKTNSMPHLLLAGPFATGPFAIRKDFRSVYFGFQPSIDEKADPRNCAPPLPAPSQQRDSAGTLAIGRPGRDDLFSTSERPLRTWQHHSTSNESYGDRGSIFGDPIIATAILDRLLHHSTTINIRGESYRLKAAGKPVCSRDPRKKRAQPPFPPQRCRRTVLAVKGPLRRAKPTRPRAPRAVLAALPNMRERGHEEMQLSALAGSFVWGFLNWRNGNFNLALTEQPAHGQFEKTLFAKPRSFSER